MFAVWVRIFLPKSLSYLVPGVIEYYGMFIKPGHGSGIFSGKVRMFQQFYVTVGMNRLTSFHAAWALNVENAVHIVISLFNYLY